MVGNFPGSFKWSGSELLPDGRLLLAPLKHNSALLFSPDDKSWEEVGNFGDGMKWNGCKLLPDGRVVFVPFDSPSIVVFDPQSRTWQSRPHGKAGSSAHHSGPRVSTDCAVLPDGRVLFVPCSVKEIMIFTPPVLCTSEKVDFQGDCKWSGCAVMPTGKVVFVPQYASTILIFDYG